MVEQGPQFAAEQAAPAEAESEGFDLEQARELGGFIVRAARRRPRLTVFTFVSVAVVGLTASATMPRMYSSEVKLLAQRSSAIRAISGNERLDPDENPTKNVAAMIMRRDNLVALAKDAHLVERFAATRPSALRLKDRVTQSIFGAPSEEDKLLGMVFTLERQLEVSTNVDEAKESNLTIAVEWSNPRIAFDLVTLVQKNFLEARYDSEVAVINDSLAVLEDHAKTELDKVDIELGVYQKMVAERSTAMSAAQAAAKATSRPQTVIAIGPRAASSGAAAAVFIPDPEVTKALEEKRMQIRALEDARQHTIASLRQQLVQAQLTLTPMHPSVIALQQQLDAVSQTPPELAQLRSEERSLMAQLVPPRVAPTPSSAPALPGFAPRPLATLGAHGADAGAANAADPDPLFFGMDRDGPLRLEESKLGSAIREYEDAMGRIDSARVELEITRAAYKYKYTVVTPAELPKGPKKATARTVAMGSVIGGLLLALLLAAGIDLARGSILESWQVRRRLKLQVLGELDRPA
jgi:uncharacterized protein involved in exopolysaccharide biosynthesis